MAVRPEHIAGNRYRVRIPAGKDPVTGRYLQRSRYFEAKNQSAANRAAPAIVAALQVEVDEAKAVVGTVGHAAESWLAVQHAERRAPNTLRRLDHTVAIIRRDLGHIGLDKLSVRDVEGWYTKLRAENVADDGKPERHRRESTVHTYHAVLRQILLTVERQTGIPAITRRVSPPKQMKPNPRPPESAAVSELIRTAPAPLNVIATAGAMLGLRRAEILGLRWTDFQGDVVEVRRNAIDGPGGATLARTKTTESMRTLEVPAALAHILAAWRGMLERSAVDRGVPLALDSVVFPDLAADPTGRTPISPAKVTNAWMRHRDRAGYPHVRFHDLRHWAATVLLAAGKSIKEAQGLLGHSTPTTTLSFYSGAGKATGLSAILAAELELPEGKPA